MFIRVDGTGTMTLEEPDDFKRFHVEANPQTLDDPTLGARFRAIATDAGDDRVWLDGHAVADLSGRAGDTGWQAAFQAMIDGAERFGFSDTANHRIKAHIVRPV